MPQQSRKTGGKPFAIVRKSGDVFVTMQSAKNKNELATKYPPAEFDVYDMKGKDDIPKKDGAFMSDLTVDPVTKDWKWKVTDAEIAARKKTAKDRGLRSQLIKANSEKAMAQSLGPEFSDDVVRLTAKIAELEAELGG